MKMKITALTKSLLILLAVSLAACSTGFVKPEKGSPTVAQVYGAANVGQTHFYAGGRRTVKASGKFKTVGLPNIKLAQNIQGKRMINSLNAQFPKLPNPEIIMYIFGHHTANGYIPVPGHFTEFSMYDRNYYALPSEVLMPYNDGQFTN